MIDLQELAHFLDTYLGVAAIPDSCPNGIQVEGKKQLHLIATAVSANLQTVERAVIEGVDALIVHHGLFWERDSMRIEGGKKRKLKLLLEHEISLLAYHLPLDAHEGVGNNWRAAQELGWKQLEPFARYKNSYIGVKGVFSPMPIDAFVAQLENYYRHPATAALAGKKKIVERAALVSGGGYRELINAVKEGVDCFVTGNFDEPAWNVAHEEGIHFVAMGHSATERVGPRALGAFLEGHFQISCPFLDIDNPF